MSERIAVIGDWNSILGFRALGLETYPASTSEEAKEILRDLAKENCSVVYLTEQLAKDMSDTIGRYKDALRPAIILIPGREGSLGIGRENIQQAIKRAIGTDI
ncbi:MAG: V-type ATP synthase subunit F [Oscillibacter sp.]|nr:V-type ATP synthase subunit F [Oscillibacter sp.]MBQ2996856.1 V-type ATP synthase subunit F [Oscillibacter sp.]